MSDFLELQEILNIKRTLTTEEYKMAILYAKYSEYSAQNLYKQLAQFAPTEEGRKIAAFILGDEKSHEYIWFEEEKKMADEADKINAEEGTKQWAKIVSPLVSFENAAKGNLTPDDEDDE